MPSEMSSNGQKTDENVFQATPRPKNVLPPNFSDPRGARSFSVLPSIPTKPKNLSKRVIPPKYPSKQSPQTPKKNLGDNEKGNSISQISAEDSKSRSMSVLVPPVANATPEEKEESLEEKEIKMMKKRKNVSKELLTTERTYVSNLQVLAHEYRSKMEESKLFEPLDLRLIFLNLDTLLAIHNKLLKELEERLSGEWNERSCIGDVIKSVIPFMKMYVDYVNAYDKAEKRFTELLHLGEVKELIEKCGKEGSHGVAGFYSLHINPIQRVPRFGSLNFVEKNYFVTQIKKKGMFFF